MEKIFNRSLGVVSFCFKAYLRSLRFVVHVLRVIDAFLLFIRTQSSTKKEGCEFFKIFFDSKLGIINNK